jgi:mRNA-binding protein PUF3
MQAQSRGSMQDSSNGLHRAEEIEEIDRRNFMYLGPRDYPGSQHLTNQGPGSSLSFAERYLRSGTAHEFQPGQPYQGTASTLRASDNYAGPRTPSDWQDFGNAPMSVSRRSPGLSEHQAYLDPRVQQLMAAQLRNQYAAMYNPYMSLHVSSPYLVLMPVNMSGADISPHQRDGAVGEGVQSALMYEFKSNTKTKRYELRDIYDHIAEFSGDQHGSRFIQTKLETANSDEKERVFREIEPNAIPLMTDVFGNYVIQKFFEHGDQIHKKILANKMKGQVLQLSLQMYGCRVVQKALDHVLVDQQAILIGELEGNVIRCVKDQNGNHVIQKAIERCPPTTINFIINAFRGQVQHLSIHSYGCRVIQRCLEKCDLPAKSMIMAELLDGIPTMIFDQYGNYVVQHIVQHDDGEGKRRVLQIVGQALEGYSKHKFASNVVEKCLEMADDTWRRNVVLTLGQSIQRHGMHMGDGILVNMIKDNFGNYVIRESLYPTLRLCIVLTLISQKNSSTLSDQMTTIYSSKSSSQPWSRRSVPAAASKFCRSTRKCTVSILITVLISLPTCPSHRMATRWECHSPSLIQGSRAITIRRLPHHLQ